MSYRIPPPAKWTLLPTVTGIALIICAVMVVLDWHAIITFGFRDPDDALRYVEVRDFVSGQNWFDVSQHRVNPPIGGPMHWSRLVDLPIAALMLLLRPLFGAVMADRLALATVPLLLTSALCFMTALAVRRLKDDQSAIVATALIALSMPILIQFQPMRIDHHGWQILMAAIALWATFDPRMRRGGVIAGIAVAFWTHVSSEGLPYAVLFGGVFAIAFLRDRATLDRLLAYAAALTIGSAAFLLGTHKWDDAVTPYCDSLSSVYLLPMAGAALVLFVVHRIIGTESLPRRTMIPFLAGLAGAAVYIVMGDECRTGPFGSLDPIVYKYWYLNIGEGRPVWEQVPLLAALIVVPPLLGILGTVLAIRTEQDAERRFKWIMLLVLALGTYAVSLAVMRAISTSYLMALPGLARLGVILLPKAQRLSTAPARILATLAVFTLTPMGVSVIAAAVLPSDDANEATVQSPDHDTRLNMPCSSKAGLAGLAALPRGTIMAPLDIGPALLAFTPHSVVATGHHRNPAMRDVLLSFMSPPTQAHAIIKRHEVRYVAYCSDSNEVIDYMKLRPHGLMNSLETRHVPTWLRPVSMRLGGNIHVYQVTS